MPEYQIFLIIFLGFFTIHFVIERVLAVLNARSAAAHRDAMPPMLDNLVTLETQKKSVEYTLAKTNFGHIAAVWSAAVTLMFLVLPIAGGGPILPGMNTAAGLLEWQPIPTGIALIMLFAIGNSLMHLGLEIYGTFWLEARFGFNKTTLKTWILDRIKGLMLMFVLGIPFLYGLLYLVTETGPLWWLWAALFVITFQFLMMFLFPVLIAPLFNKFTPLEPGELKQKLEELAQKCNFAARGIFVVDGSRRSAHSNAYFTGIGKSRRIVLFDTLIQQLTVPELTAVLAHEIGHYKKKHIVKMLLLSVVLTLAGFYILNLLIDWIPMYQAFSLGIGNRPLGLIVFSLIAGDFTFWVGPLFNKLSRKHEYEADTFAFDQTGSSEPLEKALLKLHEKNLSNLTPHPIYSAYHYSHPTLLERLKALRALGAR